ncbi:MAG: pyrroloquinoline quinone-dependent dehydrogenase [Steroidobacteraceae bacterium]|nr:pyrroloquinoline quinone-dependent dehydrogenase [Steroidobacteraceae bacterium]
MIFRRSFHAASLFGASLLLASFVLHAQPPLTPAGEEWRYWGGDAGATHYSTLTQIKPSNVDRLEVAWIHESGDHSDGSGSTRPTTMQVTPLMANQTLYYCTPFQRVFALDPETGEPRWVFDPHLQEKKGEGPYALNCRGVSYWEDSQAAPGAVCAKRLFYGTSDSDLIALDADTGKPCTEFGVQGRVALREALDEKRAWAYHPTSPPQVLRDRVIVNGLVADNLDVDSTPGVVRAFDARTGQLLWAWDPVPQGWQGPRRGQSPYYSGTVNSWSIMTGDAERGLIFVPTGNPSPDLYGGQRNGIDHYGSSTVALDVETGAVVWSFQSVHHDLWDYDTSGAPILFQIPGVGGGAPAVAQTTKIGHLFLLDRVTGKPLYPVEERPTPQGGVPGEILSPTQPFPTHPAPLHPTELKPEDAFGFTPIDRWYCARQIAKYRWDGVFTPPSLQGSIVYPHTTGGMNWGGAAIDPERGLLVVNQNHIAQIAQLLPRAEAEKLDASQMHYPNELYPMTGAPYAALRKLLSSFLGAPCNPTPWGSLTAVDLRSGEVKWRIPFGALEGLAPWPLYKWYTDTGAPNFGGGIATASGLYFIGASLDRYFRAYDIETGKELWKTRLQFGAHSVPMTYAGKSGEQYVVVAAGGSGLTVLGSQLIAFKLKDH